MWQELRKRVPQNTDPKQNPKQAPPQNPKQAPPQNPKQAPPVDPKQAPPVDPKQAPPVDPKQAPPVDPKQAPPVDPKAPETTPTPTPTSTLPTADTQPVRIKMVSPPVSSNLLFKIGKVQTFNWTYSSQFDAAVAPKNLNMFAKYNDQKGYNFTVAVNLPPDTTSFVWDTSKVKNPELPVGTYTLYIWDERGPQPSSVVGGQLQPYFDLRFMMYQPKPRTDLKDYTCAVCDGNNPMTRAEQNKPYLPIAVLSGILVVTLHERRHRKIRRSSQKQPSWLKRTLWTELPKNREMVSFGSKSRVVSTPQGGVIEFKRMSRRDRDKWTEHKG
nr:3603_t:CDS:2 [Entrophospora candida]